MLGKKIGIDLGTSTVLIFVKGEGIVINEPSLVAVNRDGNPVMANSLVNAVGLVEIGE